MLDLFLATDVVRRKINASVEEDAPQAKTPRRSRVLRSTTAAALRGLADLLEPSHSATNRRASALAAQRKA
jgi:hypothetical protein